MAISDVHIAKSTTPKQIERMRNLWHQDRLQHMPVRPRKIEIIEQNCKNSNVVSLLS